jgi:hypothetical protein
LIEQKQMAWEGVFALSPGEPFPEEHTIASTLSSVSTSAFPSSKSRAAAAEENRSSNFPPGAIMGVVIGVVAFIALATTLFYFIGRHRSMKVREAAQGMIGSEKSPHGAREVPHLQCPENLFLDQAA